jgi:hypothetical protein
MAGVPETQEQFSGRLNFFEKCIAESRISGAQRVAFTPADA